MSKQSVVVGIDNGVAGAVALITRDNEVVATLVMPTEKYSVGDKERVRYDEPGLVRMLRDIQTTYNLLIVGIERPIAMPGIASTAIASAFQGYGFTRGVLVSLGIPFMDVPPTDWHRHLFGTVPKTKTTILGDGTVVSAKSRTVVLKEKSFKFCQQMFPYVDLCSFSTRSKKPHDGVADSLCIAFYTKQKYI